jgi:hypothetical protein
MTAKREAHRFTSGLTLRRHIDTIACVEATDGEMAERLKATVC